MRLIKACLVSFVFQVVVKLILLINFNIGVWEPIPFVTIGIIGAIIIFVIADE